MGTGISYTVEFKQESVNQVVKHGYSVSDVSGRLGMSSKTFMTGKRNSANHPMFVNKKMTYKC